MNQSFFTSPHFFSSQIKFNHQNLKFIILIYSSTETKPKFPASADFSQKSSTIPPPKPTIKRKKKKKTNSGTPINHHRDIRKHATNESRITNHKINNLKNQQLQEPNWTKSLTGC